LANTKIPHDVCGLAATLVLLYGHDDLALIESTCFHYPKNQKLSFSLFSNYGGNTKGGKVFEWAADPEGPAALCTQGFVEYIGKNHNFK
jgi:hypothetical protein